jgi:hypothetical protein
MSYDTTVPTEKPTLLAELRALLAGASVTFQQERTYRRAVALFVAELLCLGRHTVTQLLRSLGSVNQDWSAWYRLFSRDRFPEVQLSAHLLRETLVHVPPETPYTATIDAVIVARTGTHVAGSSWWRGLKTAPFQRGLQRGQRFVETAWLTPEEGSYCRAIPLRWFPAVTAKAVPSVAEPCKEWEAGLAGLEWLRAEIDRAGRAEQQLVGIGDGNYDVQDIWRDVPERTTLVIRCARNRKLFAMPEEKESRGPGRPPSYGPRLPTPAELLRNRKRKDWTRLTLTIRGRKRELQYRIQGPCLLETVLERPLFLIVVRGQTYTAGKRKLRHLYRKPYHMLVNAIWQDGKWHLPFSAEQLLTWAWQRWECEVSHREMKSAFGIGEKQCWGARSALTSVQWGVWVYGVCVLAAYRAWGILGGPRRAGAWYQHASRWTFASMWQAYRAELWGTCGFSPLSARSLANWLKPELWATGLGNALEDPGRV